jgi:probable phosphoglycerate mutase
MSSRPPLIFVRHGETDWNRELRFQGQQDIPLNDIGRRQAERNGVALRGILAAADWRLIASPLGRAEETMRILLAAAGRAGARFETDPVLREASYGDWEGLTLIEIAGRFPGAALRRDRDKWGFVTPNGESYAMVSARIAGWLSTFDRPTLVVSHGGVLRALHHLLAGLPTHDAPHLAAPQDRVTLITGAAVFTI